MTDDYPPFRLDMGGGEPERPALSPTEPPSRSQDGAGWSPGRIVSAVIGVVLGVVSTGLITCGWIRPAGTPTATFPLRRPTAPARTR